MAGSGVLPLSKIPHFCLPEKSRPCLSPSVADHPLRPATDHCLGRPLPHQLANPTRAPPLAINLSRNSLSRAPAYAVLAEVSLGYPPQEGRFPHATHPCATH